MTIPPTPNHETQNEVEFPLRDRESRTREAEKIHQEFIRSQRQSMEIATAPASKERSETKQ